MRRDVRHYYPNQLGILGQLWLYLERWIEFLFGSPVKMGRAGGVFCHLGDHCHDHMMSVMVMPLGLWQQSICEKRAATQHYAQRRSHHRE